MFILKKKYKELESKLEAANKKLKNKDECLMALEFKYDNANDRIKDLEYRNEMCGLEIQQLEKDITDKDSYIINLLEDMKSDKMQYDLLENEKVELKKQLDREKVTNWCNEESKRQLRLLADEILESDDYKKQKVWKYLHDIADRIGATKQFEIIDKDEVLKNDK